MHAVSSGYLIVALFSFSSLSLADPNFSPYTDLSINTHWSPEYQAMEPMDLQTITANTHLKALHLAFMTDSGSCQPAWGSQATYSLAEKWGQHVTDALAKQGVDITVSFGGASGNDLSMNCNEKQLEEIFKNTITTYQAKKLDFDVENGTANVPKLISALTVFQQHHPDIQLSFTLPVLPEGLVGPGKDLVSQAVQAKLKFNINIMTMDFGPDYRGDMGDYTKQAATALHDYLSSRSPQSSDQDIWQQIEVTPMIGVNDVTTEQFTLQNAKAVRDFVFEKKLGGFSMWSLTRDKPCADKWTSPTCSGNHLQKNGYDFVQMFLGQ